MKLPRRQFLHLAAGAAALPAVTRSAWAQTYPTRPITMIVPASAGGPTDTIGRILAERMRASLGQTIVIENVSGAGGSIAVGRVARAAPDGYVIGVGHWGHYVVNGALYGLPYDLRKDFEPVYAVVTKKKKFGRGELLQIVVALHFPVVAAASPGDNLALRAVDLCAIGLHLP